MNKEKLYRNAIHLPMFDWQISLFGAHSQKVDNDWTCPIDSHQAFETIAILSGKEIVTIKTQSYLLNQGDMIIIKPGQLHTTKSAGGLEYLNFHFVLDSPLFNLNLNNSQQFIFKARSKMAENAWPLFHQLMAQHHQPDLFASQLRAQIILSKFLLLLNESTNEKIHNAGEKSASEILAIKIYQSIKNIFNDRLYHTDQVNLSNSTIIEEALSANNISHSYANRLFRDTFGINPRHFLSTLREEAAKQLLTLPDNTITTVAHRLGYNNQANFSRQFKKWTGMSPSEFQNHIQ